MGCTHQRAEDASGDSLNKWCPDCGSLGVALHDVDSDGVVYRWDAPACQSPLPLGLYTHYKGGLYTLVAIGKHGATHTPWVAYLSHEHADGLCFRPVNSEPPAVTAEMARAHGNGWSDVVGTREDGKPLLRFTYVGQRDG
jgi:hypothetical protein